MPEPGLPGDRWQLDSLLDGVQFVFGIEVFMASRPRFPYTQYTRRADSTSWLSVRLTRGHNDCSQTTSKARVMLLHNLRILLFAAGLVFASASTLLP
jgi:hypothetical protein